MKLRDEKKKELKELKLLEKQEKEAFVYQHNSEMAHSEEMKDVEIMAKL